MAKYMINIFVGDQARGERKRNPSGQEFIMNKYRDWTMKIASKTIVAHKLKDSEGRRLELVDSKVQDGPFTETKETIGGFYIVDVASYDEAVELAKECPTLLYQGGYIEVRAVEI